MTLNRFLFAITAVLLVTGCAHPITVIPDASRLERSSTAPVRIAANVGYYIPPAASSIEITTPGGGGDNVRYFPYRDIETGFQKMLSNVFASAVKLTSISDSSGIARDRIDYIIVPEIVTTSGGSGLTWSPTSFTVDLTCNVRDSGGTLIASPRVVGAGGAETSERLPKHCIAGRRAMEDALLKMQASLLETRLRATPSDARTTQPKSPASGSTASGRLAELKELKDKGLISQEEYEAKRKALLEAL